MCYWYKHGTRSILLPKKTRDTHTTFQTKEKNKSICYYKWPTNQATIVRPFHKTKCWFTRFFEVVKLVWKHFWCVTCERQARCTTEIIARPFNTCNTLLIWCYCLKYLCFFSKTWCEKRMTQASNFLIIKMSHIINIILCICWVLSVNIALYTEQKSKC